MLLLNKDGIFRFQTEPMCFLYGIYILKDMICTVKTPSLNRCIDFI